MAYDCEECCKNCCYSTPFSTLAAVLFTCLALAGFVITGFYGVSQLNDVPNIQNGTEVQVMGPVIAIATALTIVPLILVTIGSYFITGYIRDILFHGCVKCCVKSYFANITLLVMIFVTLLYWLFIAIGLGGVMSFYIQWMLTCPEAPTMDTCITYVDAGFNRYLLCGDELEATCPNALGAGLTFSIALLFVVLVIIGLIIILMAHVSKFVNGRDYYDYRQDQKQDGFFSKNSR